MLAWIVTIFIDVLGINCISSWVPTSLVRRPHFVGTYPSCDREKGLGIIYHILTQFLLMASHIF